MKSVVLEKKEMKKRDLLIGPFFLLFIPLLINMLSGATFFPAILFAIFGVLLIGAVIIEKYSIFIKVYHLAFSVIFLLFSYGELIG